MTREPNIAPAPSLTAQGGCSACNVKAILVANGDMKVCPRCYAILWHRDWSQDDAARAAIRTAELAAQRLHLKAERKRQWEERKAMRNLSDVASDVAPASDAKSET